MTTETEARFQVFRDPAERDVEAWRVFYDDKLLPTTWNSRGAAYAGLATEQRRAQRRIALRKDGD